MRVLRFGPSIIFLRTPHREAVKAAISQVFGVEEMPTDAAIRNSSEFETIVFVTDEWKKETIPPERAFLLGCHAPVVLSTIVNRKLPVEKVHVEGTLILMRVPDKVQEGLQLLAKKYGGEIMDIRTAFDEGEAGDTIIGVTRKKLNSPIGPEDIEGAVLIRRDFLEVYRELTLDVPVLLLRLMPEWKEITIKIYDTDKRYEENIERLMMVIEDLDLGFVVGEGWDWDYPRPFMRVPVYKLKLLTWEDPVRVKFLLKGLEYRGYKRLCDIDVFIEKKKISWTSLGKFSSKFELAKKAREELEKNLSEEVLERLRRIEEVLVRKVED
ncbi:hypothetical protein [Thermococcus thioreducens]|uniref:Uncharacterized protein n=1 Tax=Thermococcus thioreducens TaxID=277988 RepID=A0A0Q2S205_9EURY|nr:hypothetical protein [Thermococcus thioreducens]ASJ12182.1 hypothetical protein A3L14_04465 [Thermococcus thioreducens]KQH81579.1 hypothetical protein AMR53_10860 [Thermococcus thioreducens]SEV95339.1 hypothetical protein SAMN05216170_1075 [Thermococcus thioreducens]